jgi:hypothetical protein
MGALEREGPVSASRTRSKLDWYRHDVPRDAGHPKKPDEITHRAQSKLRRSVEVWLLR